ncbi:ABC transporter permease [Streptomyces sp. DSM 44915]|uniref:Transport permease protein n=1 Tax=Streptomyces chisholmiae TaxID=3075540 RepID=A0ABU2JTQ8_9ACTN|nr:ABC transporter permease [Streptomyces sp. DSM 44915]MDT0268367.1 ABC transporter permease [Streptomyces sp. DSM 44915]
MSETTHESASPREVSPAELAALHGLSVSGARPSLTQYIRQLWGRRYFILAFSQAKLMAQYSQAKLGQLWQVFTPLLNAFVYFLIFGLLLQGRGNMENDEYIPFLVTGVFVFTFTQQSVLSGVKSISGNLGLVRALHFPRASLPISFSLQQLQQLLYSMIVLAVIVVSFGHFPRWTWLLVVPALALQLVFNVGLAMIMARLGSSTPDLVQLMPFVLRTWMYASGVMFPLRYMVEKLDGAPVWLADVLAANPAAVYMDLMRYALIDGAYHDSVPMTTWWFALGWAVVIGIGGFVYFWKAEERYGRG